MLRSADTWRQLFLKTGSALRLFSPFWTSVICHQKVSRFAISGDIPAENRYLWRYFTTYHMCNKGHLQKGRPDLQSDLH